MTSSSPTAEDLSGRVAVVTGGSRGLGFEMALAFARAGADVVVASRKQESCDDAAARITATTDTTVVPIACHVGRWQEIENLVEIVHDRLGSIDVLVNNAGMSPLYPSLEDVTEPLFDKVLDVNLKGPFRLSVVAGERMRANGGGAIVNISSIAAVRPTTRDLPYAAAKAGLNAVTIGLAQEFGPTVRVNAIMAGPFLTDVSQSWDMERFETLAAAYPLQRAGQPEEIVGTAMYLATAASSFTTGTVLTVDGGSSIVRG